MKRILALILTLVLLMSFSGCQLAIENIKPKGSFVVGTYITTEPVYDTIYATLDEKYMDYDGGAYVFDDQIEGIPMYYTVRYIEEESNNIIMPLYSDKLFDGNVSMGPENVFEATLKFTEAAEDTLIYFNTVYQNEDGEVYINGELEPVCCQDHLTYSFNDLQPNNENEVFRPISVKVEFEKQEEIEKFEVVQMGPQSETGYWMNVSEYTPDNFPKEIKYMHEDTDYIIFKTYTVDGEVESEILDEDNLDYSITFPVLKDDLFYSAVNYSLNWNSSDKS